MKTSKLTSVIYTYVNRKKETFEVSRFHYIKNQKQLDALVDKLLDIDAVTWEDDLTSSFPVLAEVKNNTFGPRIARASSNDLLKIKKEIEKLYSLASKNG